MTRYAIVQNDTIINVIEWDGKTPWSPPKGCDVIETQGGMGVGFRRKGNGWIAPPSQPQGNPPDEDQ